MAQQIGSLQVLRLLTLDLDLDCDNEVSVDKLADKESLTTIDCVDI